MLEMDGSVLAPPCHIHPPFQELQGVKAITSTPRGASRDISSLSTSTNVHKFFCLGEGDPA